MKIARVSGSVAATVKYSELSGIKLLLADIVDGAGKKLESAVVLADSLGAGRGDLVLIVQGSSARVQSDYAGLPIDACTVAVIDEIDHG